MNEKKISYTEKIIFPKEMTYREKIIWFHKMIMKFLYELSVEDQEKFLKKNIKDLSLQIQIETASPIWVELNKKLIKE